MINYIYIDNSLFGRITTDVKIYEAFYDSIRKQKLPPLESYYGIASPFTILEAIGVTIKNIQPVRTCPSLTTRLQNKINRKNKNKNNEYTEIMNKLIKKLIDDYYNIIKDNEILSQKNINIALNIRLGKVIPEFREYYNKHFSNVIKSESEYNSFLNWIVFDRVQCHKIKKTLELDYCSRLILTIGESVESNRNHPHARSIQRIWNNFVKHFIPKNTKLRTYKELQEDVNIINKYIKFHGSSDLMDIEMVYYSILGRFNNGKRHPAYCFTCDSQESVITRIALCKSITRLSIEMYSSAIQTNLYHKLNHGKIIFCRKNGEITKILSVEEDIPDILEYIDSKSWKKWLSSLQINSSSID